MDRRDVMALSVIVPVCLLLLALAIVGAVTAGSVGLVFLATFLLVGFFVVALSVVTVQIDDGGIRARSPLGIQAIGSALSEIEHVLVHDVKALREFGWLGTAILRPARAGDDPEIRAHADPPPALGAEVHARCSRRARGRSRARAPRHRASAQRHVSPRTVPVR